jgi:hydrogenase expression/formation protein HypE
MGNPLPMGKLPARLLGDLLEGMGEWPADVRLGPAIGEDAAAIDVPAGVLVVAADPITLTGSEIGALAVTINANDVAVMGARPRWFLATVLLPVGTTEDDVLRLFVAMRSALLREEIALVGGHTEVTAAVTQPVVSGQMLGMIEAERLVTTGGARLGDVVVQIGSVPVEGAAVLAAEAADRLSGLDPRTLESARAAADDPGISVVEAALRAADLGATSMHDPTEGGLAAGLHEVAAASGHGIRVDRDSVAWFVPGVRVCEELGADPWATLASGCVVATFGSDEVDAALEALGAGGFTAAIIGEMTDQGGVVDGDDRAILWPDRDEVARLLSG